MKKKFFAAVLAATMVVSLCACGEKELDMTPPSVDTMANIDNLDDILKLDDYKVTEDDVIDAFVAKFCAEGAGLIEVKDRTKVQKGDVVQVDYTGYLNDKAFDGGSANNTIIDVSKNCSFGEYTGEYGSSFIDKFTDGLIGAEVKADVKHKVTFPTNYSNSTLAGKETTFEFHVDRIYIKATPDNITDEYVKEYFEDQGFTTKEALLRDCREELISTSILSYLIAESKVSVSEGMLAERLALYEKAILELSGAESIDAFASSYYQTTAANVRPYWSAYVQSRIITETVLAEYAKSKDLKPDQDELKEYVEELIKANSSMETEEDVYYELGYGDAENGKSGLENQLAIKKYILEKYRASQAVTE